MEKRPLPLLATFVHLAAKFYAVGCMPLKLLVLLPAISLGYKGPSCKAEVLVDLAVTGCI